MCGIIAYIGKKNAAPIMLNALKRMEYRGYDSSGIALINQQNQTETYKEKGTIDSLKELIGDRNPEGYIGIGHTRWATHGKPNQINAHPHTSSDQKVTIIHNGIIENYLELKTELLELGYSFLSETDTEVLANLIAENFKQTKDILQAVFVSLSRVEGAYGLAVITPEDPSRIIVARKGSPLIIGVGEDEVIAASDALAMINHTDRVIYLEDNEVAELKSNEVNIFDLDQVIKNKTIQKVEISEEQIEKLGFDHFLIKEIFEQPKSVLDLMRGRILPDADNIHLGGLSEFEPEFFKNLEQIVIVGCGTAYYAGVLAKYYLEKMLKDVVVTNELGSEFRYRSAAIRPNALGIVVTQSGETADTLASLRELKNKGIKTLGIVNVVGSSIAREVDAGIYLHAGAEISVASTKAFTSQVLALIMAGIRIARSRDMSSLEGKELIEELSRVSGLIQETLKEVTNVEMVAEKIKDFKNALYLGRDNLYPVALEGALKIKEISYIHAEGTAAGEMKHGINALIDSDLLAVILAPKNQIYSKTISNLQEVKARSGFILAVTDEDNSELDGVADLVLKIPSGVSENLQPFACNMILQLLAYFVAVKKGNNVDKPRNLAKSVTVE